MIALPKRLAGQRSAIASLGLLYAGKTSGILVAILFLPLYNRVLGPDQFGVVAVILSLQALLMMMDLGMSTMVSREVALASSPWPSLAKLIRTAESCLSGFYLAFGALAVVAKAAGLLENLSWTVVLGAVGLFWALVLQNLYYSAMLARRDYGVASAVQLAGIALRALASAHVLTSVSAALEAFIAAQLAFALLHAWVSRHYCFKGRMGLAPGASSQNRPSWRDCIVLCKQGRSLVLFSAAGAAATQLDKPLVSALVSSASVAPYFLATTLCMVPISLLAGPVSQYFQPKLLNAIGLDDLSGAHVTLRRFVMVTLLMTGLPALAFWFLREPLVHLWLGQSEASQLVPQYVAILLPGFSIGALGFIPYALLIAAGDYRFQARLSAALTLTTLATVVVAARGANVEAVCWIYALYHALSTVGSWLRAVSLNRTAQMGRYSLWLAIRMAAPIFAFGFLINRIV